MKILVFSDSHSNNDLMMDIIQENKDGFDCIFHTGDHADDAMLIEKNFPDIPVHFVRGNNDMINVPFTKKVILEGVTFVLTHGHKQNVYFGASNLFYFAEENGADVVVFGHTHEAFLQNDGGIAVFNGGSITYPRDTSSPSFGTIEINDGDVQFNIFRCTKKGIVSVDLK